MGDRQEVLGGCYLGDVVEEVLIINLIVKNLDFKQHIKKKKESPTI